MKIEIDNKKLEVIIQKKISTKNIYIRVKDDLNIYVTANKLTSDKKIMEVINDNHKSIVKMINRIESKKKKENDFYYLGKKYDIVYCNNKDLILGEDKVFINRDYNLLNWYKREAEFIFKKELDKIYQMFPYKIPYPSLTIRKMKSRWGVCNIKLKRVTLNLELIKKSLIELDYVIVHELSHLVYANHSKDFWKVVEEVMPNYKEIRKELKTYE